MFRLEIFFNEILEKVNYAETLLNKESVNKNKDAQ